ncbi:MAG: hypothetical protein LUE27_05745 [Clostridia bacterium]|nr:hypothetical protein [Clostridia bacterium]
MNKAFKKLSSDNNSSSSNNNDIAGDFNNNDNDSDIDDDGIFCQDNPDSEFDSESEKYDENRIGDVVRGAPMSFEEADSGNCNPNFGNGYEYGLNCQACVAAFIARLNGFDVIAKPFDLDNLNPAMCKLSKNTSLAFLTEDGKHPHHDELNGNNYFEKIDAAMEDGEIYSIEFDYSEEEFGHIFIAIKEDGKVFYYDPQDGTIMRDTESMTAYMAPANKKTITTMNLTYVVMDTSFCRFIFDAAKHQEADNDS